MTEYEKISDALKMYQKVYETLNTRQGQCLPIERGNLTVALNSLESLTEILKEELKTLGGNK